MNHRTTAGRRVALGLTVMASLIAQAYGQESVTTAPTAAPASATASSARIGPNSSIAHSTGTGGTRAGMSTSSRGATGADRDQGRAIAHRRAHPTGRNRGRVDLLDERRKLGDARHSAAGHPAVRGTADQAVLPASAPSCRVRVPRVVLPQQVLAVVVAVGRADHGVDVRRARPEHVGLLGVAGAAAAPAGRMGDDQRRSGSRERCPVRGQRRQQRGHGPAPRALHRPGRRPLQARGGQRVGLRKPTGPGAWRAVVHDPGAGSQLPPARRAPRSGPAGRRWARPPRRPAQTGSTARRRRCATAR